MVEYKNLNNISQKLRESIPPMEGEVVFQMLNGHKNNDPDREHREREPILYGKTQIPTYAKIRDPFANDGKGAFVNIGVPTSFDVNGNATGFRPFLTGMHDGKFNGKFSLIKGRIEDEELYEIFWLLNENESNPHRDKSVLPLFRIVNHKNEVKSVINQIDILREAIEKLKSMQEEDYLEFADSQNYTETNPDFIKAQVSNFAKAEPDKFLVIVKDPATKVKANLKKAMKNDILVFDAKTKDVSVNGNKLTTIVDGSEDILSATAKWIATAKNGKNVYDGILRQLNAEKETVPEMVE